MQRKLHQTIRRVTEDFGGRWHFNTSIAAIMELVNELYAYEDSVQRGEAGRSAGADGRRAAQAGADAGAVRAVSRARVVGDAGRDLRPACARRGRSTIPRWRRKRKSRSRIQVNGKIRSRITVPADAEEAQVRELALADEKVKAAIDGKEVVKVLVVKGRLVNIVVK